MASNIEMALVELKLLGYKLVTKQSILKGATYTWFEPIAMYDTEVYMATYSDSMVYVSNLTQSIANMYEYLKRQEQE
jgi:hypothetical protein